MLKIFKGDYNRSEFYSIMGQFFAERQYRKLMPYLVNENNSVWYVEVEYNEVQGFITYVEKLERINIGYCYVKDNNNLLEHNLITIVNNENLTKDMYIEIEKSFDINEYVQLGFEIYKETTNYWFLRKKVKHEDLQ